MNKDINIPAPTAETEAETSARRSLVWVWTGGAVLLVVALVMASFAMPSLDPMKLVASFAESPETVVTALILLMILHNVFPVPAEAIAMCAGAVLGVTAGIIVIWLGAMVAAAIAFGLSRHFGRSLVEKHAPPRLRERIDRVWHDWGVPGLLGLRFIPLISFNLVNYGAGLTSVGWWSFLWTTAVGIVPVLVLSVAAGAGLQSQVSGPAFYVVLAGICVALLLWQALRRRRSASSPNLPD